MSKLTITLVCVVPSSVDELTLDLIDAFQNLDDAARRRLFVALTRAQMAVELVLSERAEACPAAALGEVGAG